MESRIRNRIFLCGILCSVLALFIVMVHNYNRTYKAARNIVIELSKTTSQGNAEKIETFFIRHEDVLITAAQSLEYDLAQKNNDVSNTQNLLKKMSNEYDTNVYRKYTNKDFTGIYASINGQMVHGFRSPDELPEGYNPLERPWYKEGISGSGNVVFGEPYSDIYDPSMIIMTATKLLSDNQTVIAMDITLNDLQAATENMDVSVNLNGTQHVYGYGFLVTDAGYVVAHRDINQQNQIYEDPENPMYEVFQEIKKCAESSNDYFETRLDGTSYFVFPYRISNGWYVVTLTDSKEIDDSMSDFFLITIFTTGLVLLLVLAYTLFITISQLRAEQLSKRLSYALNLAKKDGLTGHSNRTAYDIRKTELEEKIGSEQDESFAIIMMDLNDLKYVNDNYGHVVGDEYIRNSCKLVHKIIPNEIFRIGGDEFAMFLSGKDFEHAKEMFKKLTAAVEEGNKSLVPNVEKPSIAIGMSIHIAKEMDDMQMLLHQADTQMYTNKANIKQARLKQREKK